MKRKSKRKSKRRRRTKRTIRRIRADRKRKHSPARSTCRSIIPESRIIVIKPKNRIAAPPNNSYVSTLTPPTCIPNIISPINFVPNSPEAVHSEM